MEVFEINDSFCLGAARKFSETLLAMQSRPAVVILRVGSVLAMDATGLQALEDLAARLARQGTRVLLSGVHAQPLLLMERSGCLEHLGADNVFASFDEALERARAIVVGGA